MKNIRVQITLIRLSKHSSNSSKEILMYGANMFPYDVGLESSKELREPKCSPWA